MQLNWEYIRKKYKTPAIAIGSIAMLAILAIAIFSIKGSHTKQAENNNANTVNINSSYEYNATSFSSAESEPMCARLTDDAGLLNDSERTMVLEKLDSTSSSLKFDIVIITVEKFDGKTPRDYADDFYDYNNFGYGNEKDGILLLVSMENRDWHITTTGRGIEIIDDNALDEIADSFLSDLSAGKYYKAFSNFIDTTKEIVMP